MTSYYSDSGLAYTAASAALVADFEAAITSYLGAGTDTMSLLDAILVDDPDMPMAVCFRGYLLKLAAHRQFAPAIRVAVDTAQALIERLHCNERERAHVAALRLWCEDRADAALQLLEATLADNPLDMLALRIAHYLHFYNGRGELMCDSTDRVLGAWTPDHPHYSYLLGMHAFGLEESGEYGAALEHGREAVTRNSADIWATHAVAHVYEMQNLHEQGIAWLDDLRGHWGATNNFRFHVIWHEALHWLGLGEPERALAIYDDTLAASVADDFYLDLCNNASLLWRLEFAGIEVGDRWCALAEVAAAHAEDQELVFASLHYLIPLAVTGSARTPGLLTTLRAWADSGTDQGRVCATVGLALADAIVQATVAPGSAADLLCKHQSATFLIGGSNAQRDLFRLLANDTAVRANRPDLIARPAQAV